MVVLFPGAVRTEQPEDLALADRQVKALQGRDRSEPQCARAENLPKLPSRNRLLHDRNDRESFTRKKEEILVPQTGGIFMLIRQ